jgi:hypothetical protein
MSLTVSCIYTRTAVTSYYDLWRSSCGKQIRIDSPEEVGWSHAPLPTDGGAKFCAYCGKPIQLSN